MKVRLPIVEPTAGGFAITGRVELLCEFTGAPDDPFVEVRMLEAGAGLEAGAITVVPATELRDV